MEKPPRIMHQLEIAKRNPHSAAVGVVCEYVWNEYGRKVIARLFSYDNAEDQDDIQQIYMLGMIKSIEKIDHRGNPLYHLHKRGYWSVHVHTRKGQKLVGQSYLDVDEAEGSEPYIQVADYGEMTDELVIRQLGAEQQVRLLKDAEKSSIVSRAMAVILEGRAGDPTELGFNRKLAAEMGVSPQRGSQSMRKMRVKAKEVGLTND